MRIFAVESSATAASVALWEEEKLIGQFMIHTALTHSQTLVPMMDSLLRTTALSWSDVDALAVATGPGSFTGIRIGVSGVKGIAFATDLPCVGVSTLEAMAWPLGHMENRLICCVMDARRQQVYNALFRAEGGQVERLCDDRTLSVEELTAELNHQDRPVLLVGDGAPLCYGAMEGKITDIAMAPPHLRIQSAAGVAMAAQSTVASGETVSGDQLVPRYLRRPQAERELLQKQKNEREQSV